MEFGEKIENFNMVPENANDMFSNILNTNMEVDEDKSGIFRKPENFIHFEEFSNTDEWIFAVALQPSTFNVFERVGSKNHLSTRYRSRSIISTLVVSFIRSRYDSNV